MRVQAFQRRLQLQLVEDQKRMAQKEQEWSEVKTRLHEQVESKDKLLRDTLENSAREEVR